jgi:hypothetical protein
MSLEVFFSELEMGLPVLCATVAGIPARKVSIAIGHRAKEVIVVADILLATLGLLYVF